MNGGVLLALIAASALWPPWPFGRDRGHGDDAPTIQDLDADTVAVDTSARIDGSEAKAMESYRLFLDLGSNDPALEAEAMRRLADLQLETDEAEELKRNIASLGGKLGSTIGLYKQLLASYPNYAKNDLVLYQLARAYEADGQTEEALKTLDRLVTEYPQTPHYDEANFRRGETLFVARRYAEAEQAYRRVLAAGPDGDFAEQAQYKLGWTLFKQGRYDDSLEPFFALLDTEFRAGGGAEPDPAAVYSAMGRAEQELVDDTFRVLSIGFSYMNGPDSVSGYFERNGERSYTYIVYTSLGDLYLDKERYQDAADAYRAFVELDPYDARAPLMLVEVSEAYKRAGFADLVLDSKREFVERYGPESPYWSKFTFDEQPEVVADLKADLTDLAAYHHARAQEQKDPDEYAAAARWYRTYLRSFPDGEEAAQKNFLLAEVLYDSGRYDEAATEYERTAYAYPLNEHSAEAGYAALLAYAEHEKSMSGEARAAWHLKGIESALRFAQTYPDNEQTPAVLTDTSEKLYALNDYTRARDVAQQVVTRGPPAQPEQLRTAWTVVAHSDFDLGDFADAETAYTRLRSYVPADDPEQEDIDQRIASSIYKQGEQARDTGDMSAAVDNFLRVGQAVPDSPIRPTAEYDAAAVLIKGENWQRAITVLEGFRSRYPDHELAASVTADLAVAYSKTGDNQRAAAEFERIADGDGADDVKREALWRAAQLYERDGAAPDAAAAYERFVERYPEPVAESIDARQHLADLSQAAGDEPRRVDWLQSIVAADAAAGEQRSDRTRYLAANAQLALAAPARDAYRNVRLVVPLKQSLEAKRTLMQKALDAYEKAADYDVAGVTTAATYEIAELYHELSRSLFDSQRPPELSDEELAQYDILLEEQAYPFEEKAIDVHEINAARTADGVYDEWIVKSLAQLAELVPARYAKEEIGERFVGTFY
jgi:tetratricopeptide (TPR) repeat protein